MKHQFAVTPTIHQTEITALLDSWVTKTSFVKNLCPQKFFFFYVFVKT